MKKFTLIFLALVMCLSILAIGVNAADCKDGAHDWTAWTTFSKTATQIVKVRSCTCGVKTETHTFEKVEANLNCGAEGTIAYWKCTDCTDWVLDANCALMPADKLDITADATGKHTWVAGTPEIKECFSYVTSTCSACGATKEEEPVEAHAWKEVPAKAATCEEAGNNAYKICTECDIVLNANGVVSNVLRETIPAEHVLEVVAAVEASCETGDGNIEYKKCKNCDYMETMSGMATNIKNVTIPAHDLVAVEAKEATCYEAGNIAYSYCTKCDYMVTPAGMNTNAKAVIVVVDHELVEVAAKEATCEVDGNIAYSYCKNCDYMCTPEGMNTNAKAVVLVKDHELVEVAAKEATCEVDGNIAYSYCKNCSYMVTPEGMLTNVKAVVLVKDHELVKVEAKAATATENGNIAYSYCKNCSYMVTEAGMLTNQKAVILPATGEATEPGVTEPGTTPPTGDSNNAIFFVVALVAVVALGAAAVSFKKREN